MKVTEADVKNFTRYISEMRDWLLECDVDEDAVDGLTDFEVVKMVNREFDGGLQEFINISKGV
jgi:hypothetical protein